MKTAILPGVLLLVGCAASQVDSAAPECPCADAPAPASGSPTSNSLLTELHGNGGRLPDVVARILATGDPVLREVAAARVVLLATVVGEWGWRDRHRTELKEADSRAGLDLTAEEFERQLDRFQAETLAQMYRSLAALGGEAAMDYAFAEAANTSLSRERRLIAIDLAETLARSGAKRHAAAIPGLSAELHQTR